jgi:glutamine synthetase adenylyltransferase
MAIDTLIRESVSETPDPERALKNFKGLLSTAPEILEEHQQHIDKIAKLFSYSQFLADYSIRNPDRLSAALHNLHEPVSEQILSSEAFKTYESTVKSSPYMLRHEAMRLLRKIKKNYLLRITIKDICGIISLNECMTELSTLSQTITGLALNFSYQFLREKFGDLTNDALSIIGLGKLGAG